MTETIDVVSQVVYPEVIQEAALKALSSLDSGLKMAAVELDRDSIPELTPENNFVPGLRSVLGSGDLIEIFYIEHPVALEGFSGEAWIRRQVSGGTETYSLYFWNK